MAGACSYGFLVLPRTGPRTCCRAAWREHWSSTVPAEVDVSGQRAAVSNSSQSLVGAPWGQSSSPLTPLPPPPQAELARAQSSARRMAERSIDAQRASATVPRDTVQLYQQLAASGLQYGPAFRLLRNVHVPDTASKTH